jgi:hypothetical protein
MPDLNRPSLDSAFHSIQRRMVQLLEYATVAAPLVAQDPKLLPELADSVVVLVVARVDGFFQDMVSLGTRHRERAVRKHFHKHGNERAHSYDLPTLIKLVRSRVSFEGGGKRLDNLFRVIFQCSVWPSDEVRDVVLDLVLLRNLIVHNSGQDWSQDGVMPAAYAAQFRGADVLSTRRYGDLAIYSVDHYKALLFVRMATLSVVDQLNYLEEHIVRDTSWAAESQGEGTADDSTPAL